MRPRGRRGPYLARYGGARLKPTSSGGAAPLQLLLVFVSTAVSNESDRLHTKPHFLYISIY